MIDNYSEDVVKVYRGMAYKIFFAIAIIIAAIGVLVGIIVPGIGLVVLVVCAIVLFLLISRKNVEYEYTITNGAVDISAIYNMSNRKDKLSFALNEINLIAPISSLRIEGLKEQGSIKKIRDYSSKTKADNTFGIVIERLGVKELVVLELSDKSLDIFKICAKNIFYSE